MPVLWVAEFVLFVVLAFKVIVGSLVHMGLSKVTGSTQRTDESGTEWKN
jgi:hypothetical protein